MILENFYYAVLARIGSWLSGRNWLWKLTFFSVGLSVFLAFPYHLFLKHLAGTGHLDAWTFIENQSHNLFRPEGNRSGCSPGEYDFQVDAPAAVLPHRA